MTKATRGWIDLMPYIGLTIALVLSSWSFVRSEQYRRESEITIAQTHDFQWKASQAVGRFANITGYNLSILKIEDSPFLTQEILEIREILNNMRNLQYADSFFEIENVDKIIENLSILENQTALISDNPATYSNTLNLAYKIRQDVFHAFGNTRPDRKFLNAPLRTEENNLRNLKIFGTTLSAIIFVGIFIRQRTRFVRRRDQQIRSSSSLFVHMTRTRIAALGLFMRSLEAPEIPNREMVAAAGRATKELSSLNEGLARIAYSDRQSRKEPLAVTIASIVQAHGEGVRLDATDDARAALVPTPQFHLILDELIQNAKQAIAVAQITEPHVTLCAHVISRAVRGRRLILEVNDNGIGMDADILEKAKEPFFSTKAGAHVGLGLTGCAEMVNALRGKFRIKSTPGVGTSVRIVYPL